MFQFLNNIPPVTKNLLFINVLMYIVTLVLASRGIELIPILGAHYVNSPLFMPYQIVTYFFMHSTSIFHIFFNMFALVMFGALLERMWGPKRFFIFYVASAIGAFALYNLIGVYDLIQLKNELLSLGYTPGEIVEVAHGVVPQNSYVQEMPLFQEYYNKTNTPMVGASGAIFGIMAGFAYLFPNTEMMMMFIPVPVKAKYMVGGYFLIELYLSFQNNPGDSVAHLAHVGGAVVGFILVYIWNKNRKTFY